MSNWKSSYLIDLDILVYGYFCTPCLFGENSHTVNEEASCLSYACSYGALALSSQLLGMLIGNFIIPNDPELMVACASYCNAITIGVYAGNMRTKLRNHYLLSGSSEKDMCIHCLCTMCAVCQEAQEIRTQKKSEDMERQYMPLPEAQTMLRDDGYNDASEAVDDDDKK